jgi:hypothetical protein
MRCATSMQVRASHERHLISAEPSHKPWTFATGESRVVANAMTTLPTCLEALPMGLTPLPQWYCAACNTALEVDALDQLCHRCLERTWEALARELTSPLGLAFGRPLRAVFTKPRRGPDNGWRRPPVEADDDEEGTGRGSD